MSQTTDALMQVLNFTDEDLNANRDKKLSDAQIQRLQRIQRRNMTLGVVIFFGVILVATTFIFIGQQNESLILSGVGGLLTVVNAIMVGSIGRSYMRTNADLRDGGIEVLSGKVERVVRPGRQQDNYLIRIDDTSIYVTKEIFLHFKHEAPYRLYRTRLSGVLLSAERVK